MSNIALIPATDLQDAAGRLQLTRTKSGAGRLAITKQKEYVDRLLALNAADMKANPTVKPLSRSEAKRQFLSYRLETAAGLSQRVAERILKGELQVDHLNVRKDGTVSAAAFIKPTDTEESKALAAAKVLIDSGVMTEATVMEMIAANKARKKAAQKSTDITATEVPATSQTDAQPVAASA